MPRLPHPGKDQGQWGQILNDYLSQVHKPDGTLKDNSVTASIIAPNTITTANLSQDLKDKVDAVAGQQGATGPIGATGPQGPSGTPGASGTPGTPGASGVPGTPGTPGSQGATGASGTPGTPGTPGTNGAIGATGPQGPSGLAGATGVQGATGASGTPGTNGSHGATGATGPAGQDGQDGAGIEIAGSVASYANLPSSLNASNAGEGYLVESDGKLYIWSGTSFPTNGNGVEFRGPQGATGPNGATGPAGTNGASGTPGVQGATGAQGIQGTPGATGATGASGSPGATTIAGISGLQGTLDGKVTTSVTMSTVPVNPQFSRNITYALATDNPDIAKIAINGIDKYWHNEWGAIRGTSPYSWGDALVRAIRSNGDGITNGEAFQLSDRRSGAPASPGNVMWGVRWTDGRMVQGGQPVGAVYWLEHDQDESTIPATLPAGTLIVRKAS